MESLNLKLNIKNDPLLSPKEAAALLRVEVSTLATWRCTKKRQIGHVKVGRNVFYPLSEIQAFVDAHWVKAED